MRETQDPSIFTVWNLVGDVSLTIRDANDLFESRQAVTIFVTGSDLEELRSSNTQSGVVVSPPGEREGRKLFRCLDPDGNVIELRELNGA